MTTTDQLEPGDAALVDTRGREAMAEVRRLAELVELPEPDAIHAPGRRRGRWMPALAVAVVLLVVASVSWWWVDSDGERLDSGPAHVPTTATEPDVVHHAPIVWPPGLEGPTRAGTIEGGDPVAATWVLERDGVTVALLQVLDGDLADLGIASESYDLAGRPAAFQAGRPDRLWVEAADGAHVLTLASREVDRAGLEAVGSSLRLVDGELDLATLPARWAATEDRAGVAAYAVGGPVDGRRTVAVRAEQSGGLVTSLSLEQFSGIDAAEELNTLVGLMAGSAEPVVVADGVIAWILAVGASNGDVTPAQLLAWAPAPDVLLVMVPTGIDEQDWMTAARTVAPVSDREWQEWVRNGRTDPTEGSLAHGMLGRTTWQIEESSTAEIVQLMLTSADGQHGFATLGASPGDATVGASRVGGAIGAVAAPAGLTEARLTLRGEDLDGVAVDYSRGRSTLVFAVVPDDDDGLPPPSGVLRLTGTLPDGSAFDSRTFSGD